MMKAIVFAFLLSILLCGCDPNDQYSIEKKFWQTQKQAEKIFKNPHASPPKELARVVSILNNFALKYPKTDLAVEAELNVARLYIVKAEYLQARQQLKKIMDKYSSSNAICSEAVFLTGNSYEIEEKWDSALPEYKKIMQDYPVTFRGLDMPVYIAEHYKIKVEPAKMSQALQEAVVHYRALAAKYVGSEPGFRASTLAAQCFILLKDWQNAINTFEAIISDYKDKVGVDIFLMNIALIYNGEIKDQVKTKEVLEKLIREYPRSRFTKAATNLLKELEKK